MVWEYSSYSKINPEAVKHFPFKNPRPFQLETVSEILEAIQKGYKYIVLEAGTGTGKSAVAAALAGISDSSYILTVTKQLQDQYLADFTDLGFRPVKGRGNFRCRNYLEEGIMQNCDAGKCVIEGETCRYSLKNHDRDIINEENTCGYYYQKFLALNSEVTVANYHYMFLELNNAGDFSKRSLMICDEAHSIESVIMNQLTLEFDRRDLKQYLKFNLSENIISQLTDGDSGDWIRFVEKIKTKYETELSKIENVDKPHLGEKKMFIKNRIDECVRFLNNLNFNSKTWIFDYDDNQGIARFRPLKIDSYAEDTLFSHADVCILMSATILDYRLFTRWLGISPDEVYAVRRKSPFDIKRNPIKTFKGFNMSYSVIEKTAPETLPVIEEILLKHKNEKGIIHTVSAGCRDFLVKNITTDRFISHDTANRSKIIDEFRSSPKPLVLVSPSVSEGVDLPGDECRFQIIYKIPYPDLGDRQISMRNAADPKWYDYRTSLALVQTHGRGMRFEEDYCTTYFIDSRLEGYISHDLLVNSFLPDTFIGAVENFSDDITSEIISSEVFDVTADLKYEMIEKGNALLNEGKTERAIAFYRNLVNDSLFQNDSYPYRKLAEIYSALDMYEEETQIIIMFFKSHAHASEDVLEMFKKRLKRLDSMGYFEYVKDMKNLEHEFIRRNAHSRDDFIPLADDILKFSKLN